MNILARTRGNTRVLLGLNQRKTRNYTCMNRLTGGLLVRVVERASRPIRYHVASRFRGCSSAGQARFSEFWNTGERGQGSSLSVWTFGGAVLAFRGIGFENVG